MEELSFIDGRLNELDEIIKYAKVARAPKGKKIDIGSKVIVAEGNKRHTYLIVGEWEADPREKKISHNSPLGKALVGKKEGEEVVVEAPSGRIIYKIVSIE